MRIYENSICYLLQTFNPPDQAKLNVAGVGVPAHRVFGGAMLGLNSQQWDIIEFIGVPAYMGAAEYENGVLNSTVHNMAMMRKEEKLNTFVFTLSPTERKLHYCRQTHMRRDARASALPAARTVPVFVISPTGSEEKVKEMIRSAVQHQFGAKCKRDPHVVEGLDKLSDIDGRYCGWLDVQHDLFFFADEEMYKRACQVFDLAPVAAPEIAPLDVMKMKKKELVELAVRLGVVPVKSHAMKLEIAKLRELVAA